MKLYLRSYTVSRTFFPIISATKKIALPKDNGKSNTLKTVSFDTFYTHFDLKVNRTISNGLNVCRYVSFHSFC